MPRALETPDWALARRVLGDDLHPGGQELTRRRHAALDARPGAAVLDLG